MFPIGQGFSLNQHFLVKSVLDLVACRKTQLDGAVLHTRPRHGIANQPFMYTISPLSERLCNLEVVH